MSKYDKWCLVTFFLIKYSKPILLTNTIAGSKWLG